MNRPLPRFIVPTGEPEPVAGAASGNQLLLFHRRAELTPTNEAPIGLHTLPLVSQNGYGGLIGFQSGPVFLPPLQARASGFCAIRPRPTLQNALPALPTPATTTCSLSSSRQDISSTQLNSVPGTATRSRPDTASQTSVSGRPRARPVNLPIQSTLGMGAERNVTEIIRRETTSPGPQAELEPSLGSQPHNRTIPEIDGRYRIIAIN